MTSGLIKVKVAPGLEAFRAVARPLLTKRIPPGLVCWEPANARQRQLFGAETPSSPAPLDSAPSRPEAPKASPPLHPAPLRDPRLPKAYFELAKLAVYHAAPSRYDVLYRVAYRVLTDEPRLLEVATDPDVLALRQMSQAVARDLHKMHAFVRFQRVDDDGGERYIAWHRPDAPILRLAAPFFVERFRNMRFTIATPDESCDWDGVHLEFGPGVPQPPAASGDDDVGELFVDYYRSIFNPARLNLRAMQAEMPAKHWRTLPEARVINELARDAPDRVREMLERPPSEAAAYLPSTGELPVLREAAEACHACPLHGPATRTVFGEGPAGARLMLVGEQPGDEEDLAGRPFVGPAGKLLDEALSAAGISRSDVYLTNAVKHFKFIGKAGRRLHQRPHQREVRACRAWVEAEIRALEPMVIVCLGNTAAQSFLGPRFNVMRYRGRIYETAWAKAWLATIHPAAVLRASTPAERAHALEMLISDLRTALAALRAD